MAEQIPALETHQLSFLVRGFYEMAYKTPKLSSILKATFR